MSEHSDNVRFRADWRMTLFVLAMLPLVVGLGIWQLRRADFKQQLADAYFDQLGGLPQVLTGAQPPPAFTRVRLRGHYEDVHLLLDNQVSEGRPGYWVYTPFTTRDATWLINRGWLPAPRLRSELPSVPPAPVVGENGIVALTWPDTGMIPLFGAQVSEPLTEQMLRMQRLDFADLLGWLESKGLGSVPLELRLEEAQPGVFRAAPQAADFGVERHQGYAFQWFGLAIALVTGYFFFGRSKTP